MKAYKYFDRALRSKILDDGAFRIGTLYDYRKTEAHGSEIGDSREGKVGAHSEVLSWSSSDPKLRGEHAATFVQGKNSVVFTEGSSMSFGPGGSLSFGPDGVSMRNLGLRSELQVQDLYVFSFSTEPNADLMHRMGYDACYEISDVEEFFRLMERPKAAKYLGLGLVQYRPREMHYDMARSLNPALIKEPGFAYQKEGRALWQPALHPIVPTIVSSPAAAKLCSVVDLGASGA